MRVSMSAIGSVSIGSPARLGHARDRALMREVAQADPADAELAEHRARPAAPTAARVVAHLELLRALLLDDEARLGHALLLPPALAERQAEGLQQRAGVADARQRDRDQSVEELVHARTAKRHLRADRHSLTHLELRDRLAGPAHLRALAGDRGQLFDGRVEQLRVGLRLPHAHVERDLLQARDLHDGVEPELVLQLRADLAFVSLLQARRVRVARRGAHGLSISWPQSLWRHTRTRTVLSLTCLTTVPTRVGFLHVGHTIITFETGSGAAFSMIPPGMICGPPMRLAFWIGRGR